MTPAAFWATYGQEAPRLEHPKPFMCATEGCSRPAEVMWTGQWRDCCAIHVPGRHGPPARDCCPAGHEQTPENRIRSGLRGTQCRICKAAKARERRAQRRTA